MRLALARRSEAMTGAPERRGTPRTIATLLWTEMSAPMRCSSLTCMKRFSKIVSVIRLWPSARVISAMNCACMSVAKPG